MSLLEVSNVKKTYTSRLGENTVEALKGVNFSVESGEYIAIMGESGSGKTTLLSLFNTVNEDGQTIVMVTHSTKAASHASRVLFIKDGVVYHQIYRGDMTTEKMYQKISDTLTILATGGERHE